MAELYFSELRTLSPEQQQKKLLELTSRRNAPVNGQLERLEAEIREFEQRYELSSSELAEALRTGKLRETAEVGRWLILIALRQRLVCTARQ